MPRSRRRKKRTSQETAGTGAPKSEKTRSLDEAESFDAAESKPEATALQLLDDLPAQIAGRDGGSGDSRNGSSSLDTELQQLQANLRKAVAKQQAGHEETLEKLQSLASLHIESTATHGERFSELESRLDSLSQLIGDALSELVAPCESSISSDAVAQLEAQLNQERIAREQAEAERQEFASQCETLVRERDALQATAARESTFESDVSDLRARLDEACREADDLRTQNEELAQKLASSHIDRDIAVESMTWEQRKQHILSQLDAEDCGQGASEPSGEERIQMRDLVERTNQELAARDSEIAELRRLLEEQSSAVGEVAIGGAAVLEMLEQDELLAEERSKLQDIQREWEEKLRQAEIDVSLERAKLARERMELEQQLAELPSKEDEDEGEPGEPQGRRWLARLGITED